MKVFPNLIDAIVDALIRIFQEGQKADQVVQEKLKSNPKWGGRDRRFIADQVYEVVRWYRRLYEVLGHEPKTVEDWKYILAVLMVDQKKELPSFDPFNSFSRIDIAEKLNQEERFAVKEAIPEWLDQLGRQDWGEQWEEIVTCLNQEQAVYLRVNTAICSVKECLLHLEKEGVMAVHVNDQCIKLLARKNLQHLKIFKEGWFEVQDRGSQEIVPFLNIQSPSFVIDTCAGGGGKTLQIAQIIQGKGKIVAMDIHAVKLKALKERAFRAGINDVTTVLVNQDFDLRTYREKADYVLIDAPCSGTGVLRRNPDTKWKMNLEKLQEIQAIQSEILSNYATFVKPGGTLVYATCSVLSIENQEQVRQFLESEQGKHFELEEEKSLLPQELDSDGFYMARLHRKR